MGRSYLLNKVGRSVFVRSETAQKHYIPPFFEMIWSFYKIKCSKRISSRKILLHFWFFTFQMHDPNLSDAQVIHGSYLELDAMLRIFHHIPRLRNAT